MGQIRQTSPHTHTNNNNNNNKGKHLYGSSLERHHSGFLSRHRNSKRHSVRTPIHIKNPVSASST